MGGKICGRRRCWRLEQSHCENSLGSCQSPHQTKPTDFGCVSTRCQLPPTSTVAIYYLLLSPKTNGYFTVPQRDILEGWVDVGNAVRVPKAVIYHSNCRRNRDCPRWAWSQDFSYRAVMHATIGPLDRCTRPTEIVKPTSNSCWFSSYIFSCVNVT